VYIFNKQNKRFRSSKEIECFIKANQNLGLKKDQFSFSITHDRNGPKAIYHEPKSFKAEEQKDVKKQKLKQFGPQTSWEAMLSSCFSDSDSEDSDDDVTTSTTIGLFNI